MSTINFIKKYKRVLNIYKLEKECRLRRNTISHAIGKEKREIPIAYEAMIIAFLQQLETDLCTTHVEYYKRVQQPAIAKELSLANGVNRTGSRPSKRQAG